MAQRVFGGLHDANNVLNYETVKFIRNQGSSNSDLAEKQKIIESPSAVGQDPLGQVWGKRENEHMLSLGYSEF